MAGPDDEIEEEHLDGLHFGNPHPHCYDCEMDPEAPEAPDPTHD